MRPMSSLDTLDLVPGDSLGPFQLGKSLYEILSILRSGLSAVPAVEVSWAHGVKTASCFLVLCSYLMPLR